MSRKVNIRKGVKQGCPLSPLLFNIAFDPIFSYLESVMKSDEQNPGGYKTEELGTTYAQAYADDIVLIDETITGLQKQINACERFLTFAGIQLNPNKCEVFKVENKKPNENQKIVIGNVTKDYIPRAEYIKYLGVPQGAREVELSNTETKLSTPC
jgi:hypothetical protein